MEESEGHADKKKDRYREMKEDPEKYSVGVGIYWGLGKIVIFATLFHGLVVFGTEEGVLLETVG